MKTDKIIIEQVSQYDVSTTVEKLVAAAEKKGWQNPATHNLQNSLAKSGKTVKPVQVVEICKPEYSGKMLEKNHERIISVLMPCRISVYEKEDGHTYIALLDSSKLIAGLPPVAAEAMQDAFNETVEMLKPIIKP